MFKNSAHMYEVTLCAIVVLCYDDVGQFYFETESGLKHTLTVILIILLCVVLLSGCKNNSESEDGYFYKAEVIPFPELPAGFEEISNVTLAGDIIYFTASVNNISDSEPDKSFRSPAIFSMTSDGKNLKRLPEYSSEAPPPEATGGGIFISAMHADAHGNLWIVETGRYYISQEPDIIKDAGSILTIRKLDSDGTQLLSADISDIVASFDGFYVSMFTVDEDGRIYIGCSYISADETIIYVMDSDFKILFDLAVPVWPNPLVLTNDGFVAFVRQQNNEKYLQKIDVNTKTLGDSIHLPENILNVFSGYNNFLILYMDSASLYGVSGDSGEAVQILKWIDSGVITDGLENISFLPDGRIFLTKSTPVSGSWDNKHEIIFLTKTESHGNEQSEGVAEKTELTLGTLYLHPALQNPIHQFNNTSTTHYITVIDYSSNTTPDDTEGALLRFSTEITTGKIPDILILTGIPFDRLITLNLLVDLNPFLDADLKLSREDLIENVLAATQTDGKLFHINQSFMLSTIVGNPSVLGEYPGWNIEEFKAVIEANPQADIPLGPNVTKQDFLWVLLYMNLYEYIDTSSGTSNFNNEEFIELLEFINTFPSEVDDSIMIDRLFNRGIKTEGRQIMDTYLPAGLHNYTLQKESFGGEIAFKGWPAADRNGHRFISHDSVAITANATDKEGAWEFVRTLLMEEHQREYWIGGYPINKAVFEEQMQRDMEPMSFMSEGMLITVKPTQAEADEIMALINSTTKITGHGSDGALRNIIIESATDFFNGRITAEDAARIIQNRVSIFLAEQE